MCVAGLCHVTILPCIAMRIYRGDCCGEQHNVSDIHSFYKIEYAGEVGVAK